MTDFESRYQEYVRRIEAELDALTALHGGTSRVAEAMRYSLLAGGKRIRPVLTLASCEALGGRMEDALPYACALEMIHTYSLIHDDLPCMDNDDMRRGRPTNHVVYGETTALLAGDALLTLAASVAVRGSDPQRNNAAVRILFDAAGVNGMIGGQEADLKAETCKPDLAGLESIHRRKTGALIVAAVMLGAVAAGKRPDTFYEYAASLGLAFQIRDDILDVEGDAEKLGKPIFSDEANDKATFVTLCTMEGAKARLAEETKRATNALTASGTADWFLAEMADYLLARES